MSELTDMIQEHLDEAMEKYTAEEEKKRLELIQSLISQHSETLRFLQREHRKLTGRDYITF